MKTLFRWLRWTALVLLLLAGAGIGGLYYAYVVVRDDLPTVAEIRDVRLQVPLRVYTREGRLIASFGEMRRTPMKLAEIPLVVQQAFLAAEDARFYEHPGVDYQGVARAVVDLVRRGGEKGVGGSTITQQLARNVFLSPEVTFERKFREMVLALKMEQELGKEEILELYLNKIFLGHRAYGVAAAAEVYYGKTLAELTLAEAAMLAAIPKAPSRLNPVNDPIGAIERRDYVLRRMLEVGYIDAAAHEAASQEPNRARLHSPPVEVSAPYVAEMVRQEAERILGADALIGGYSVYTTIGANEQTAANEAARVAVLDYDRRHGYRGPEARLNLRGDESSAELDALLAPFSTVSRLQPAIVRAVDAKQATLYLAGGKELSLELPALQWARRYLNESARGPAPQRVGDVVAVGDVVRVAENVDGSWSLAQLPKVQCAFVALDPEDGAVRALVGGFNFERSKFNRAVQSMRQPGSSFKPFIYSAALEKGFTTASIINDAPIVFHDPALDRVWKPQNDNATFLGPTRLREAMVTSRNLVSVRVLDAIGVRYAREFIQRFGFSPASLPENLSLALGTNSAPPLVMARGYAVFANGGYLVDPHLIERIVDADGREVFRSAAPRACARCPERLQADLERLERAAATTDSDPTAVTASTPAASTVAADPVNAPAVPLAPRAIDERNAYIIATMLLDVVKRGTGRAAMTLGRTDLGGKTGTTNDHRDAWFSGFGPGMVASAWVGFDDFGSLGEGEFGARAALPIWVGYAKVALEGVPNQPPLPPPGVTTARINPTTGHLVSGGEGSILEVFRSEDLDGLIAAPGGERTIKQDPYEVF